MDMPATVSNVAGEFLAANQLGRALYAPLFDSREQPANTARFTFLDPAAVDFFLDWDRAAGDLVARLRSEAGRNPYDRGLSDLVGELSTRSDEFRARWAAHNVRFHRSGTKRLRHPVVGELELTYESWSSRRTPDYAWRSSPPNPAAAPRRPSTSSPAGPPRPTSCPTSIQPPTTVRRP